MYEIINLLLNIPILPIYLLLVIVLFNIGKGIKNFHFRNILLEPFANKPNIVLREYG